MKPLFCPKCHRRVELPKWLLQTQNLNVQSAIKLKCAHCDGHVKFKPTKVEENVLDRN